MSRVLVTYASAHGDPEDREPATRMMRVPGRSRLAARAVGDDPGGARYLEYDRFTRAVLRLTMKRGGHPADASRDYEYTDWDQVEEFACGLAKIAAERAEARATAEPR